VPLEQPALKVLRDFLELRAMMDHLVMWDLLDQQEHKEIQELLVFLVLRVIKDSLEHLEILVRILLFIYVLHSKGVCDSLGVKFEAIRLTGLRFKPLPGQTFGSRFLLHAHPETLPQVPKTVPLLVPSPDTKRGLAVGSR